jgi:hypothetical protein
MKIIARTLFFFLITLSLTNPAGSSSESPGTLFERLRSLEGKWEGTARWIEIPNSEFQMNAIYSLTGRGTAVVEDLIAEGVKTMTSVYHLDGNTLRMTHYCAAGNQPRLKALPDDKREDRIKFHLVDVTNLASPDAPHVTGAEIVFNNSTELTITFDFTRQGKKQTELIQLVRVDPK